MQTSGLGLMAVALLATAPLLGRPAAGADVNIAQLERNMQTGPSRSPKVLIEEPRPPSAAIETEGRGQHRNCRDIAIAERQNGVSVTRTEQHCDR
jgi:hypothetical protein